MFHPFFAKEKNAWRIGSPPSSFTPSILQGWPLCHLPHWSVAFDHIHDPGSMPGPNAFYKNVDVHGINWNDPINPIRIDLLVGFFWKSPSLRKFAALKVWPGDLQKMSQKESLFEVQLYAPLPASLGLNLDMETEPHLMSSRQHFLWMLYNVDIRKDYCLITHTPNWFNSFLMQLSSNIAMRWWAMCLSAGSAFLSFQWVCL